MTELWPVLAAAFTAGLLGSAHCLGMCAGISGLFAVGSDTPVRANAPKAVAYNLGRVAGYALLGAIVAALGGAFVDAIPSLAGPVRLLSGALIVVIGLQVAFAWRILAPIEKMGARLWQRIAPFAKGFIPATTLPKALALGFVWGWLPCGLVYSALLIAATTADAGSGALTMTAFGLGTMPAMLMTGLGAATASAFVSRNRVAAGLLIALLGVATLAMPVINIAAPDSDHAHHHGMH